MEKGADGLSGSHLTSNDVARQAYTRQWRAGAIRWTYTSSRSISEMHLACQDGRIWQSRFKHGVTQQNPVIDARICKVRALNAMSYA